MKLIISTLLFLRTADAASLRHRGPDGDESAGVSQAIRRAEAVESVRSSHVLCRIAGDGFFGSATVRLHVDNSRSLVFNNDVDGVETKVKCRGNAPPQCLGGGADGTSTDQVAKVEDCPACPCDGTVPEVYGAYSQAMAEEVEGRCGSATSDAPMRVLMLGLGAGQLATRVVAKCGDNLKFDAVELDGRLPVLAKMYFGMPESVKVTVGDAGPVAINMQQSLDSNALPGNDKKYDVVLVDCFSTGGVTPEHCRTPEFVQSLKGLVRDNGQIMHHLWHVDEKHPEVAGEFATTVDLYKKVFACDGCKVDVRPLGFGANNMGPDDIVVATVPAEKPL